MGAFSVKVQQLLNVFTMKGVVQLNNSQREDRDGRRERDHFLGSIFCFARGAARSNLDSNSFESTKTFTASPMTVANARLAEDTPSAQVRMVMVVNCRRFAITTRTKALLARRS